MHCIAQLRTFIVEFKTKAMKTKYQYQPTGWQLDPHQIETDKVQFWSNGIMLTLITNADAKERVKNKEAFVISGTAIGLMKDGYSKA